MNPLRVAVVDDEALARERLSRLLAELGCEVVAELKSARALREWLKAGVADALFLDIQMPGGTGLELLAELTDVPPVIFVTAHSEYAVRAFDTAAVDYLLKPVYKDRLERALARLQGSQVPRRSGPELEALARPTAPRGNPGQRFPVKAGGGIIFLEFKRVSHFEVVDEVVWAWAGGKQFRTSWTALSEVEQEFHDAEMIRIQRNVLLRSASVLGLQSLGKGRCKVLVAQGQELEVSRTATPQLRAHLGLT